jgi:aminoglycoside phosphotransferase (APT) family kinase protein
MHEGQLDIDERLVRGLLERQFARWAGLPLERVPSDGTVNAIFRLGDDKSVRLPLVDHATRDLERELRWLPLFASHTPIEVPAVVAVGHPDDRYPYRWAVLRWLPGRTWDQAAVGDERRAAEDLAGFVLAVRALDPADGPRSDAGGRGAPVRHRDELVREAIELVFHDFRPEELTEAWERSLEAPDWAGPPTWLHADLLPGNVLVADGRIAGILDFGAVCVGDPACDVMPAWTLFSPSARAAYRRALAVDDAMWLRARGWALSIGLIALPYYRESNPGFADVARRIIRAVLDDADDAA